MHTKDQAILEEAHSCPGKQRAADKAAVSKEQRRAAESKSQLKHFPPAALRHLCGHQQGHVHVASPVKWCAGWQADRQTDRRAV